MLSLSTPIALAADPSMNVSLTVWVVVVAAIIALIVLDLVTVSAHPHEVKFKEAALWSIVYIGIAVAFGIWVQWYYGGPWGTEYFAGYLVEKSLSVDNVFVFAIILAQFAVPAIYQQRVLLIGVILALILRAIFIAIDFLDPAIGQFERVRAAVPLRKTGGPRVVAAALAP